MKGWLKVKLIVLAAALFCSMMAGTVQAGDNGNGTVTVGTLVWLKNAGCLGRTNIDTGKTWVKSLAHGQCGLKDKSRSGDWRMPKMNELLSIMSSKGLFSNVDCVYWAYQEGIVPVSVNLLVGQASYDFPDMANAIWAVRDKKQGE